MVFASDFQIDLTMFHFLKIWKKNLQNDLFETYVFLQKIIRYLYPFLS